MAGILLPLLMFVTIVATANHFILDAIVGAAVAGLSYELSLLFAKLIKHGVSPEYNCTVNTKYPQRAGKFSTSISAKVHKLG